MGVSSCFDFEDFDVELIGPWTEHRAQATLSTHEFVSGTLSVHRSLPALSSASTRPDALCSPSDPLVSTRVCIQISALLDCLPAPPWTAVPRPLPSVALAVLSFANELAKAIARALPPILPPSQRFFFRAKFRSNDLVYSKVMSFNIL